MDTIEFEPYDSQNLKRIGTGQDSDGNQSGKNPIDKNKSKPGYYKIAIAILIAVVGVFSFKYYQNTILYPKQTNAELLDIRSALYHHKESFGTYPNQLTELAKGRPLREAWSTDAWEHAYRYQTDESKQTFIVTSAGFDGKFDTDDDIQIK